MANPNINTSGHPELREVQVTLADGTKGTIKMNGYRDSVSTETYSFYADGGVGNGKPDRFESSNLNDWKKRPPYGELGKLFESARINFNKSL